MVPLTGRNLVLSVTTVKAGIGVYFGCDKGMVTTCCSVTSEH